MGTTAMLKNIRKMKIKVKVKVLFIEFIPGSVAFDCSSTNKHVDEICPTGYLGLGWTVFASNIHGIHDRWFFKKPVQGILKTSFLLVNTSLKLMRIILR